MKTVLICHQSGQLYGSDRILLELTKILSRHGFRVIIILESKGPLVSELKNYTSEIFIGKLASIRRRKSIFQSIWEFIPSLMLINKLVNLYKPDQVVTNTIIIISSSLVAKMKGIKHIWLVHEYPKNFLERFVYSITLNILSDVIVVPTEYIGAWVKGHKLTLIPYVEQLRKSNLSRVLKLRKNILGREGGKIIACIGMIHPKKGQHLLIKIAEKILQSSKNMHSVIVGDKVQGYTQYYNNIKREINKSTYSKNYHIVGFKKEAHLWTSATDCVVIPSLQDETFPLVLQESLYFGKLIVTTNFKIFKKFIKHKETGLIFNPSDCERVCSDIVFYLNNPKSLNRLQKNAKMVYKRNFKYEKFEKDILRIFS